MAMQGTGIFTAAKMDTFTYENINNISPNFAENIDCEVVLMSIRNLCFESKNEKK